MRLKAHFICTIGSNGRVPTATGAEETISSPEPAFLLVGILERVEIAQESPQEREGKKRDPGNDVDKESDFDQTRMV